MRQGHYLSCQAVRRTAYLNFCAGIMLKGLGHKTYGLRLGLETLKLTILGTL